MNNIGGSYCFSTAEIIRNIKKLKIDTSRSPLHKREITKAICQDFIKLLLDDIVNTGVRFKFSALNKYNMQIHIENVTGEEFAKARRLGAFYEVDPLASNFEGNHLVVSWRTSRYVYTRSITVGFGLKDIITAKTNAGEQFMGRTVTIRDYIERMGDLYPEIFTKDIRNILNLFQIQLMFLILKRASIMIKQLNKGRTDNFLCIINGISTYDNFKAYLFWRRQITRKIRIQFKMLKRKWNGYYYFALTDLQLARMLSLKTNRYYTIENLMMYKLFEECLAQQTSRPHIFRIHYVIDFGYRSFNKIFKSKDFEYIYRVDESGLVPMNGISDRCDNDLFIQKVDYVWMKWIDKNLIKKKLNDA